MSAAAAATPEITLAHRQLGSSGLSVSELCLGAMTFDVADVNTWGLPTANKELSFEMMDFFTSCGGNFIDTADVYGSGTSETVVGEWLAAQDIPTKEDYVIATKVFNPMGPGVNQRGLSRKHIMQGAEHSLKRLGLETIDLYQAHKYDHTTPLEETLIAFDDLVRSGKVNYIGLSNFTAAQVTESILTAKILGLKLPIISLQPQYNLLTRQLEDTILPTCQRFGLGTLAWSPLKGGWLTGKYTRARAAEGPGAGSRVAWAEGVGWNETAWEVLANNHTWGVVEAVAEVAQDLGVSQSAVSLRWIMQHESQPIPIIGARKMSHLVDNLSAATFELSSDHMATLNDASEIAPVYPFSIYRGGSSNLLKKLKAQQAAEAEAAAAAAAASSE